MPYELVAPSWWELAFSLPGLLLLGFLLARGFRSEGGPLPAGRWSVAELGLVLLLHLVLGAVVGLLIDVPFLSRGLGIGLAVVLIDAATCAVILLVTAFSGQGEALGLRPARQPANWLGAPLAVLAFLPACSVMTWVWLWFLAGVGVKPSMQDVLSLYLFAREGGDYLDMIAIGMGAVVAAPVMEELLFRGMLLGLLRSRLSATSSVIFSSAAFALFHMKVEVALPIFFVGAVLACIQIRTGSVVYPILFHGLFNGANLLQATLS